MFSLKVNDMILSPNDSILPLNLFPMLMQMGMCFRLSWSAASQDYVQWGIYHYQHNYISMDMTDKVIKTHAKWSNYCIDIIIIKIRIISDPNSVWATVNRIVQPMHRQVFQPICHQIWVASTFTKARQGTYRVYNWNRLCWRITAPLN